MPNTNVHLLTRLMHLVLICLALGLHKYTAPGECLISTLFLATFRYKKKRVIYFNALLSYMKVTLFSSVAYPVSNIELMFMIVFQSLQDRGYMISSTSRL